MKKAFGIFVVLMLLVTGMATAFAQDTNATVDAGVAPVKQLKKQLIILARK